MEKYNSRKGITLIELIITLGLIGVITGLVFSFFFSNKRTLSNVEIKSDLQYEAKEVLNKISKYAMEATGVEYDEFSSKIQFSILGSNEKVVFEVKNGIATKDGEKIVLTGNEITFGNGSLADETISTSFQSIAISGEKDKNIEVKLTLEKKGVTYTVSDNFGFRNSSS